MRNSQKGFTLIELLAVLVITVMITSITVANFRNAQKQKQAAIASDLIINALRTAQSSATSGKATNNSNPNCRTPQYYFVNFQYQTQFSLSAFDNCNNSDLVETYSLPVNIRVKASGLKVDGVAANNSLAIYFAPPFGQATANKDAAGLNSFTASTVTVETINGSVSKTVTIDGVAGRIGE